MKKPAADKNALEAASFKLIFQTTLICFYGLIFTLFLSSLFVSPISALSKIIIWAIQIIPLLAFSFGVHAKHLRSMIWLSFISLIYFAQALLSVLEEKRDVLDIAETLFSSGLFLSLILYIANRQKSAK
ncbi:MAG: DUF2069 domain-containing protein [Gammaproteobacteria bacterium]|nr:DUF2069 domain-containing protein [Gammaproteobacteria bacterium]